ncbi:MAG: hypothetical protein WC548_00080 [Candidatus Pacearchaeota archaeon]
MVDIKEMRHEVIELAISLENFLDEEIMTYFGLDAWDASYYYSMEKDRKIFLKFFLSMPFSKKIDLMKDLIKNQGENFSEGFGNSCRKFMEIRNMFAHSLYPEIDENLMSEFKKEWIKQTQNNWEKLYNEFKSLYKKIINELDSKIFTEEPRTRRHKTFLQLITLDLIQHYEKTLKDRNVEKKE